MTTTLTGHLSYRIQQRWFGKPVLVLQVEERVQGQHFLPAVGKTPPFDYTQWRDALLSDLSTLGHLKAYPI